MMSSSFSLGVGETRPCRMKASLLKYLSQAMEVAVAIALVHHIDTKVVEVEPASVTNR